MLKAPVQTPVANSFAERWIGTLRRELPTARSSGTNASCAGLVVDYIDHYNRHRPHLALQQRPPAPPPATAEPIASPTADVIRLPRCDGLINEYNNAA